MREVAERAGVSSATVSRVLNQVSSVRPEFKQRVLAAVAELEYRPNRLARNLRLQRADMIGIVVSDIENPHFSQMVRSIEDAAFRRGYRVLLCNTDESPEKQRAYLEMLAGERALGVIVSPSDPAGAEIGELLDLGIPVVAIDREVSDPRADAVVMDNVDATRQAAGHLIRLGHRHVGFIGGPPGIETADERLQGYREAMAAAGLEPRAANGGFRIERAGMATSELLESEPRPTALISANNLMTIGVLKVLRQRSVKVPDDLALVAIDDPFWADLVEPPLTTLAQPVRQLAGAAMSLLVERLAGRRRKPKRLTFPFELRVRQSCGARRG
jgi:LacI family transcriptional regulator